MNHVLPQQFTAPVQHHNFRHSRGRKRGLLRAILRRLLMEHIPCLPLATLTVSLNILTDEMSLPNTPGLVRSTNLL